MKKIFTLICLCILWVHATAQNRTITGRVTDAQGNGILASVSAKGTATGVTTSSDGAFRLALPANAATLVVSAVGLYYGRSSD
jgi:hypothetical protein